MITIHHPQEYLRALRLVHGNHRALTHLALFSNRRHAFVKAYPADAPRGLVNDVIGYVMALHAGIEQPPGGVIQLPANVLNAAGIRTSDPAVWCFVSMSCIDLESRREGSLAALLGHNLQAVRRLLEHWPGFAKLAAFDTWLANVDRNTGNLLLTGNNQLVPIDHSDILTGPSWRFEDLVCAESDWAPNKLLDLIWPVADLPLPVRSAILKSAEQFNAAYGRARQDLYHWLNSAESDTLRAHHFIWKRAHDTHGSLARKLNMIL